MLVGGKETINALLSLYLKVVDIPMVNGPLEFSYDVEWLAITKVAHQYLSLSRKQVRLPEEAAFRRFVCARSLVVFMGLPCLHR